MSLTRRSRSAVALVAVMLAAACGGGGSEEPAAPAPEIGLLATAVDQLESTSADVQACEGLTTALSRDLDGGVNTDDATRTSRQEECTACFGTVRTDIQSALVPLREILQRSDISEETTFTPEQVGDMAGPVAAAYTLLTIGKGLDNQIGVVTALVDTARLGAPLGAGPLYGETNRDEPVETVNALLTLTSLWELLDETVGDARDVVGDLPDDG